MKYTACKLKVSGIVISYIHFYFLINFNEFILIITNDISVFVQM